MLGQGEPDLGTPPRPAERQLRIRSASAPATTPACTELTNINDIARRPTEGEGIICLAMRYGANGHEHDRQAVARRRRRDNNSAAQLQTDSPQEESRATDHYPAVIVGTGDGNIPGRGGQARTAIKEANLCGRSTARQGSSEGTPRISQDQAGVPGAQTGRHTPTAITRAHQAGQLHRNGRRGPSRTRQARQGRRQGGTAGGIGSDRRLGADHRNVQQGHPQARGHPRCRRSTNRRGSPIPGRGMHARDTHRDTTETANAHPTTDTDRQDATQPST